MALSVNSYLHGHRTPEGYWIRSNPFYTSSHHRYSAATYVQMYSLPVLRNSSVDGFFAITHYYNGRVVNTLLRQNRDASIDVMTESGVVQRHFANLYVILDMILAHMGCDLPATPTRPASVTSYSTRDPIEVVVCGGEDPV